MYIYLRAAAPAADPGKESGIRHLFVDDWLLEMGFWSISVWAETD